MYLNRCGIVPESKRRTFMKKLVIVLMGCFVGVGSSVFAETLTLEASDDSWVNGSVTDANYGTVTDSRLRYNNATWGNNYGV